MWILRCTDTRCTNLHDTIRLYLTALILHSEGVRSEQPPPDDDDEEEVEYSGR